jgi:hypothetical protein
MVSLALLKFGTTFFGIDIPMKRLLHYCSDFSSVIDSYQWVINTAEIISAV